jgi:probable phosphoglycerate mutase
MSRPPTGTMTPAVPDPEAMGAAVVLLRHAETDANRPPYRFQGRIDEPLNGSGREQSQALAESARGLGYASVWSSDLTRARDTANPIAAALGLELHLDQRLSESHRGSWEGRQVEEVAAAEPERYTAWRGPDLGFRFPGGESLEEHRERAVNAIADVLRAALPALVVCHGGTIRCLFAQADLARFHELAVPNCASFGLDPLGRPLPAGVSPTTAGAA